MFDFSYSVFQVLRTKFWGIFCPLAYNVSTKFSKFCLFVKYILWVFNHWFNFWLKFSLLYKFSFLSYSILKIVIFSWVVEFLENISAFSLKQDLVYSHQSFAEERLYPWPMPEGSYKIGSVCPSFRLPVSFLGIGLLVFFLKLSIKLRAHI